MAAVTSCVKHQHGGCDVMCKRSIQLYIPSANNKNKMLYIISRLGSIYDSTFCFGNCQEHA